MALKIIWNKLSALVEFIGSSNFMLSGRCDNIFMRHIAKLRPIAIQNGIVIKGNHLADHKVAVLGHYDANEERKDR